MFGNTRKHVLDRLIKYIETEEAAVQCIACGHVEAPADDLFVCPSCGGLDVRLGTVSVIEDEDLVDALTLRC